MNVEFGGRHIGFVLSFNCVAQNNRKYINVFWFTFQYTIVFACAKQNNIMVKPNDLLLKYDIIMSPTYPWHSATLVLVTLHPILFQLPSNSPIASLTPSIIPTGLFTVYLARFPLGRPRESPNHIAVCFSFELTIQSTSEPLHIKLANNALSSVHLCSCYHSC